MLTVSYYHTKYGFAKNRKFNGWTQAFAFASRKALDERCCPVIIVTEEGHLLYQVNK